jgi:hypothetical protein
MPLYRPRTSIYEAILFQGVVYKDESSAHYDILFDMEGGDRFPKWLRDALIDGDLRVTPAQSYLALGIEEDEVHVHPGDYLMHTEDMGIFVISSNELLEDFEPLPIQQNATVQVTGIEATGTSFT